MRHCNSNKPVFSPVLTLALTGLLLSGSIKAAPTEAPTIAFNIPQQKLTSALTKFAEQTGVQLLYSAKLAENLSAHAVNGQYTSNQALAVLLEGSGISYHYVDKNVITLEKSPQKAPEQLNKVGPTTLKPVSVTATAVRDVKDPYNEDYVLPNATSGTKTDTPIMETPLNVQVISKQVLKDQQVINLGDALKNVSGVTTGSFYGNDVGSPGNSGQGAPYQLITLRGFASESFFRNGFRLQQGSASRDMANVESVEVLKGPAAILYGLVEPGGMVNVVTKQPLATPYYALNQQFGSYNLYRTTADATGPLTKDGSLLYRMNLSYENSGSFRDFVYNDDIFLAPTLKWIISPKTQATLEMEYQHKNYGTDNGFVPMYPNDPSFTPITSGGRYKIPINTNYGMMSPATQDTIFGGLNWSHQFTDNWAIKHRLSANLSNNTSPFNSTPFLNYGSPDTVYRYDVFNRKVTNNTYSTDINLTGHFDTVGLKHTVLLGGDYYKIDSPGSFGSNVNGFNGLFGGIPPSNISVLNPIQPGLNTNTTPDFYRTYTANSDQFGFYAQDQIKLPYNFHVMGGLRYQNIHQYFNNTDISSPGASPIANPTAISQDAVTPRVGILWKTQDWLSLYANYSESFGANMGQVWASPISTSPIQATSASQYEGGIKTEFFKGRVRATLAYFDLTKTNVATRDNNPQHQCGVGGLGSCSLAIGAIRSRGPELDIQGEILPGWNAIANWSNVDIRVAQTNAANDPINGMNVGDRYFGVPRNTARFFTTYDFQNESLIGLKVGGGATIRNSQMASNSVAIGPPASVTDLNIAGYTTVDLLAAYSMNVGKSKITAQFNVNNLLDKRKRSIKRVLPLPRRIGIFNIPG